MPQFPKKSIVFIGNSILLKKCWIGYTSGIILIFFTLISYIILQTYFFYFFIYDDFLFKSLNIISCLCFIYSYFNGCFTEPGIINKLNQIDQENSQIDSSVLDLSTIQNPKSYYGQRFCKNCQIIKPPKASHCHICNNCVKDYDQYTLLIIKNSHCTFMANCIGQRNYKYFIGWIYSLSLQSIIWYSILLPHFFQKIEIFKLIEQFGNDLGLQLSILGFIFSCCFINGFYVSNKLMLFFSFVCLFSGISLLYFSYDTKLTFENNFCSSLIFILITISPVSFTFETCMRQTYLLSIGMNQKEWSVLQRSNKISDLQSNNYIDTQEQEEMSYEDKELKQKIRQEIENNEELKNTFNEDKIEAIYQYRKDYFDRIKMQQQENQVEEVQGQSSIKIYFQKIYNLVNEQIPQSELYT